MKQFYYATNDDNNELVLKNGIDNDLDLSEGKAIYALDNNSLKKKFAKLLIIKPKVNPFDFTLKPNILKFLENSIGNRFKYYYKTSITEFITKNNIDIKQDGIVPLFEKLKDYMLADDTINNDEIYSQFDELDTIYANSIPKAYILEIEGYKGDILVVHKIKDVDIIGLESEHEQGLEDIL